MKLSVKENSKNYACAVVEIKEVHPIEGADRIQKVVIQGNEVVCSKDVKVGDKMLYFVSGTKLNEDYCRFNNLLDKAEMNNDTSAKGFISHKQFRVKAIKLKGIISNGMLMPLESLGFDGNAWDSDLKPGDEFTDINGVSICEKYFVPCRNSNPGGKAPKQPARISRLVDNMFYLHGDTDNLRKNMHKINPDDIIGIHYKKHGTSGVWANIPVKKNLKWYEKFAQKLGLNIVDTEYDIVYSSRKIVKNEYLNSEAGSGFYGEDIWGVVAKEIGHLIPKNWTLYGEIIGFTPNGSAIQKGYDYGCKLSIKNNENIYIGKKVKKESGKPFKSKLLINTVKEVTINPNTNNKAFTFIEDDSIVDCHQCISNVNHKFYVYKISVVNPDGQVIYLTDKQIQDWCEKVGLLYKDTFIYYGKARDRFNYRIDNEKWDVETWRTKFLEILEATYNEKDCKMCINKVPEEGIVLRVEKLEYYEAYKLKSKRFILEESNAQEKGETNLEDNQE